uniref:Reverse transcriptase zinc-binding domain-containing protein n=1 Tax=Arundo donax TaxID=35708 RepID=A0A0A9D4A3_ARUDO
MEEVVLLQETDDTHTWVHSTSGSYSSQSAYRCYFLGSISFEPWQRLWKTWVPLRCKFFLWLAIRNRCWTADRLGRRNLPHPAKCLLCDQEEETVQHLLVSCVFARQAWFSILTKVGLGSLTPQLDDQVFSEWWRRVLEGLPASIQKGLNSLIILVAWCIWKHRNACVFDGISPSLIHLMQVVEEEMSLWTMAGAKGLSTLMA